MIDFLNDYDVEELGSIHLVTLGLIQGNWQQKRGANQVKEYRDPADNKVKVREIVTYTMDSGNRRVVDLQKSIEYLDNYGNVIHTKPILRDPLSGKKLKEINRAIFQGRVDYLETAASNLRLLANTLPEPTRSQYIAVADSIDLMFSHYEHEVMEYVSRQTDAFELAVINETDPQILAILEIPVQVPNAEFPTGLTARQSLMHQFTGEKP